MNQPVHILKKDARHLWPELLVTFCLLIAMAWISPHTWAWHIHSEAEQATPWLFPLLGAFVRFLIPVTWAVIISRLVHDESLVGDRQFWITRPYTWYGLLASKLLFIALFLYLPLAIVQLWLLHHAGLYPTTLLSPFALNFGGITAIVILPLLAIAAVTATFVRCMLSVLAGLIYFIAAAVVVALALDTRADTPYMGHVQATLLIVVPLVALLWQYARRRTALTRTLLLALPVLLILLVLLTPAQAITSHYYAAALPGQLAFETDPAFQQPALGEIFKFRNKLHLKLPVNVSGLAGRDTLAVRRISVQIDGPDGFHYTSGWVSTSGSLVAAGGPNPLDIVLPADVYDRIAGKPVALHVTLGGDRMTPQTPYTVAATTTPFPVPEHGTCRLVDTPGTAIVCAFPFTAPNGLSVEADTSLACASVSATPLQPSGPHMRVAGILPGSASLPSLDPVAISNVTFLTPPHGSVCPGTPITFSQSTESGHGSVHLDIPSVDLGPYALRTRKDAVTVPGSAEMATP